MLNKDICNETFISPGTEDGVCVSSKFYALKAKQAMFEKRLEEINEAVSCIELGQSVRPELLNMLLHRERFLFPFRYLFH